jgi:xanthine dehydrogenase/oxidase
MRHANSHALVNACFNLTMTAGGVTAARVVYGGLGATSLRAGGTEASLVGSTLGAGALAAALAALPPAAPPTGDAEPAAYRAELAAGLLYKFVLRAQPAGALPPAYQSAADRYYRPESAGTQAYSTNPAEYPVSEPVIAVTAALQTGGEAVYSFDSPMPAGGLYGFLVVSSQAVGTVSSIDTSAAAAMPGFVAFFGAGDIPGTNDIGFIPGEEPLFVPLGGDVYCIGQALGVVVATSAPVAHDAAGAVAVTYGPPSKGGAAIVTLAGAIAAGSVYSNTPAASHMLSLTCGDTAAGFAAATHIFTGALHVVVVVVVVVVVKRVCMHACLCVRVTVL